MSRFFASITGKMIVGVVLALLILFAVNQCTAARQAGKEAEVATATGKASTDNGIAAVDAVGGVAAGDAATDDLTAENTDVILNAEGADDAVPPAVFSAFNDGLCRRPTYRCSDKCLQRLYPETMADARARCEAANGR